MDARLTCEHVTKVFGGGSGAVKAVRGVSLQLAEGFHMVVGKSGCGKSTLLHMLAGLEKPSSGRVLYREQDLYPNRGGDSLRAEIRREKFGFVYQSYNLIAGVTVRDNILMPMYLNGKRQAAHFDALVETLGLGERLKALPHTLSGGEQQRVAIARALINMPDILFADEPTGNLDEENSTAVMRLLREMQRTYRMTLIMVTHNLELLAYADTVYRMSDGRVVPEGTEATI